MKKISFFWKIIAALAVVFIIQILGAMSVRHGTIWYAYLAKPPLTPPDWIFSIIWPILYVMIALSLATIWIENIKNKYVLIFFYLQLFFNTIWTFCFFYLQSPILGLIDIILLDISLLFTLGFLWKYSRKALWLLMPYFVWVIFATYLSIAFTLINKT
jgi:tryptophan-rich sensory protein